MNRDRDNMVSAKLMVLDGVGTVLLGLGILKQFVGVDVIPEQFRFEHYGYVFIAAGVVLSLPLLLRIISMARAKRESASRPNDGR